MLDDRLNIVFDDRLPTDLDKGLRSIVSEWSHTRSLSGCHDDEVHIQLSITDYQLRILYDFLFFVKKNSPNGGFIFSCILVCIS
jgi:hypothetical protein